MTEYQHGGDIYTQEIDLDFSANINPFGLPEAVRRAVIDCLDDCSRYPDSRSKKLVEKLAACHQVTEEWIICGNGAADLIFQVVLAGKFRKALIPAPGFAEYEQALRTIDCGISYFDLREQEGFALNVERLSEELDDKYDVLFLCNPNNPTGLSVKREQVEHILNLCKEKKIVAVIDECFCDFLDEPKQYSVLDLAGSYPNLFVIKAFTKLYAMAGIRLGYGISSNRALLDRMESVRQPWSVSAIAQAAGIAALGEEEYVKKTRKTIRTEREFLFGELKKMGFQVFPSEANYLFFRDPFQKAEQGLEQLCKEKKLLIRSCANYRGLDHTYYRVCVKLRKENEKLLEVLRWALKQEKGEGEPWQKQL